MSFFHISAPVLVKKQLFDLFTFSVVLIALLVPSSFTFGNSPPSDINASNLTIAENSAIGTVIGDFNATDPDGDGNFTYSIKFNFPESLDPLFWMDASDLSTITQNSGLVSHWEDKSGNGKHLVQGNTALQGRFVPTAVNNMPAIFFDGVNDNYKFQNSMAVQSIFMVLNTTENPKFNGWRWPFGGKTNNSNHYAFIFGKLGSANLVGSNISLNGGPSVSEASFAHDQKFKIIYCSKSNPVVRSDWYIGLGDAYWKGHISEVISFSDLLSENLVDQVEAYLGFKWGLESNLPSEHPAKTFSVDHNGTLTANQSFDYETDDLNYTITVLATDDHNASFDKNFAISVTNVVEDLDGDGTEDHYDDDIDGDGLTNSEELLYNSDPRDANSSNRPPSDINASNLTIVENSAIGTVIGEFNATDPDGDGNITFTLAPPLPSNLRLSLWLDASDASTITHSNGSVSQWADKSGNDFHFTQTTPTNQPTTSSVTIGAINAINFDGSERMANNDISMNDTHSIFAVTFTNANGYGRILENDANLFFGIGNGNNNFATFYGSGSNWNEVNTNTPGQSLATPSILGVTNDGSTATPYVNGVAQDTKNGAMQSFTSLALGAQSNGSQAWNGPIAEVLIFPSKLTDQERQNIEAYLAHKWGLESNLPSDHSYKSTVAVDANGTLSTYQTFDYETDDLNYAITVRATDDRNASFDKNFTITVTNVVEDLDGDGTEDHDDDDIDGDGLSNADELLYNSDPWDASSSNRPPSDINASNLTIAENSAIGTVIGEFNATDPEGDTNITYSLPSRPILSSLGKLQVWLDASESEQLSTSLTDSNPPTSGNQIKKWFDLSGNGHHAESLAGTPTWSANSFNSKPGVILNKASLVLNNSRTTFDGWSELTLIAAFYQPGERNFATLFGKSNFSGWMDTTKDLAWSVFTHRLDNIHNIWGPAVISEQPAYTYLNTGDKSFQKNRGGSPGIMSFSYEFGEVVLRVNGKILNSSNNLKGSIQSKPELDVTIGGNSNQFLDSDYRDGGYTNIGGVNHLVISEFMIFNDSLSFDNSEKVEGYLAHKWNIESQLPIDHGYKIDQPFHRNHLFTLDENGTLKSASVFDYESQSSQTILVQATDDLNASSSQTFIVQITNVVEDLDGDGTEDYYDLDIDGDGVSNANEILYSSDPLDAGSTNSPPFSFSSSSLTVAENSSIGTVVGEFNGTSSNSDDNFTFRIQPDAPDGFSPLLWLDAADHFTLYSEMNRTSYALSGAVAGWADKSERGQHFGQSTSSARPSTGTRTFNGLNVLDFNGAQWMKSNGDFATGTDFSIYMFAKIDAVASERDSLFCIRNNTPHFQIDAGHTSEFRARFLQSSMGTGKTFASSAMHQAGVWGVTFSGSRSKHVGFSFNGEGFGGSHSYDTSPNQMSNTLNIFSNRGQDRFPEGFVGEFIVVNNMDYPGGGGVQEYLQRKWLGETYDHDPFVLDTNGTLLTNRLLDFEADEQNQTFQIIASTGTKQSIPQEFNVSITDVEEDLDGDGVEDFYDSDSDGDGLGNLQEFYGRSDPMNSSSSNFAPSEINATSSLSFSESLSLDAIAADFNATDADSDANLTYRVQPKIDISNIPGISGWFDASDMDSLTTDLSGNTVLSWANQVDSSVAMIAGNKPPSAGTYLNGLHALFFDRNETMSSKKGDDVWSPWTSDGSIAGSFTDGSFFLVFRTYENQRTSLPNLGNWWSGHMPWENGYFYWDVRKGGEVNRINSVSPITSGYENMAVSFNQSVTDSSRQFFKNGKLVVSGSPVATTVLSPVHFRSTYEEPQFLYGEMIFVRQTVTHANRQKIEGYLTHKWGLADQLPSDHPYAGIDFTIDENGSLRTAREFDYETDDHNYSVRIWATDDHNATTYNDFTVTLNNVVEDLDGDGTEDHYDDDIDGDGLTNADELLYNSDPWDASSSNRPPSDINASNLTIAENSAIGTVIGEFNATDPDGEGNFTFSINSDSLLLWLPFDERNGTHAENMGSVNTYGALMNGAVFSTDEAKFGPSSIRVPISSVNSRVLLSTPIALGNGGASNPYSVSTWFKGLYAFSETVHGWRTLIRGTTNNHHIILNKESNEIGTFRDAWFGSGQILPPISSESNWQHLVATFDGSKTTFYIDGNLLGSVQKSPGLDIKSIGNYQDGNQQFAEYLDDFRVYSKVLSDREISSLYHFSMDGNGTLSVGSLVDYETDSNFTITVRVTDDHNATFDKNFTITVTNVVEDLDGDGIEDHNDTDIDGDGLSNADELAYNSDPWDASSSNRPPSDINASNLTIAEKSAIGTVIGEFNATDPDGYGNFTYSFAPPTFEGFSPLLWLDANDRPTITGISQISQWRDKSGNGFHANQTNLNYMPKIFEMDGNSLIRFDGSNDFLNPGTLRTSVGSGEVYIVAQKKSSSSDIWQRLFSSFNGSGNDYSNSPNWHMYPPFNPNGSGKIFEIQTFRTILDDRSLVNTKIARAAFKSDMFFGGDIAEIIIFNDYLAADEVQRVQGYLAHKWGFVNSLAAGHPFKFDRFSLDQNGTLTANQTFDYETDDRNYTITVRVTDDHNVSFDKNFTITVANVVEDLDGDGTEDHNDTDIDGDGLSNAEELLYNSDPWDASSINRPPSDINASNLTIAENSAFGTIIGEFNATDPDGDTNITFLLAGGSLPFGWTSTHLTGDEDSSVSSDYNYTCSVNVNGSNKTVNGVTFIGSSATSGSGWEITGGFSSTYNGENSTVGGQMGSLLSDGFRFDGNPQKVKLTGLTVGRIYVFSLYNQAWGGGTSRISKVSSTFSEEVVSINQDKFGGQSQDGHLVRCKYTANASEVEFSFTRDGSGGSWHLYAFSNHEVVPFALDENGTLSTLKSFDYETDDLNYTITVRATDDHNISFDKNFTITVTNVVEDLDGDGTEDHYDPDDDNDGFSDLDEIAFGSNPLDPQSIANAAPTDLNATRMLSIRENLPAGTFISTFNATDTDANTTLFYSLVDGNGSSENRYFALDTNGTLSSAVVFDYETNASTYSIRVQVKDEHNSSLEGNFTVTLLNANEPPVIENLPDSLVLEANVTENSTFVLEINASDPEGNSISFQKTGGLDQNFFDLNASSGRLTFQSAPDFENPLDADSNNTYEIWFRANDGLGGFAEKRLTVRVTNIVEDYDGDSIEDHYDTDDDNDGFSDTTEVVYGSDPRDANSVADTLPTALTLSSLEIMENKPVGTIVGQFTVIDPDINDSHIVKFNDINENISHNNLFTIDANNTLRTAVVFDYENNSSTLYLRVKAKQNKVGVFWEFFTISLLDDPSDNEPTYQTPTGGYQTPDGNYSSPDAGYQSPNTGYQSPDNGYQTPNSGYQSPDGNYSSPSDGYQTPEGNYSSPDSGYQSPNTGYQSPDDGYQNPDGNYQTPTSDYQTPDSEYQSPDGNYSSPSDGYQTPDSEYQSPGGSSPIDDQNETTPPKPKEIYLPILQTVDAQTDGNGTYNLTGTILSSGGSPVFEVGFLVSKRISLTDPIRVTAILESNATQYHASIANLSPNTTYYFRSYAVNQAGENRGSLKIFDTTPLINSDHWYFDTEELLGGWRKSNWLGIFQPTEHQWIYHTEMGWFYPSAMDDGSLWLWSQENGWLWTGSDIYPQLFSHKSGNWLYFMGKIGGRPRFYDYTSQSVK